MVLRFTGLASNWHQSSWKLTEILFRNLPGIARFISLVRSSGEHDCGKHSPKLKLIPPGLECAKSKYPCYLLRMQVTLAKYSKNEHELHWGHWHSGVRLRFRTKHRAHFCSYRCQAILTLVFHMVALNIQAFGERADLVDVPLKYTRGDLSPRVDHWIWTIEGNVCLHNSFLGICTILSRISINFTEFMQ